MTQIDMSIQRSYLSSVIPITAGGVSGRKQANAPNHQYISDVRPHYANEAESYQVSSGNIDT